MNPLDLLSVGAKLIDKFFPSESEKAEAKLKLMEMTQNGELAQMAHEVEIKKLDLEEKKVDQAIDLAQIAVNTEEAKSTSMFIAGWRPFIGWICGLALLYQYLIFPVLVAFLPKIQQLDMGSLLTLLFSMLGMASMRTVEKLKGVK